MTDKKKVVSEEILGLKIADEGKVFIPEAFGWDKDKFTSLCRKMNHYTEFAKAHYRLTEPDEQPTKISVFVDFLKSEEFKKLGVEITSPNDYLLLGFAWSSVNAVSDLPSSPLAGLLGALAAHHHIDDDEDEDDPEDKPEDDAEEDDNDTDPEEDEDDSDEEAEAEGDKEV